MGKYSDKLADEVRLERMRPAQISAARERHAAIYVPVGAIEWHGHHNPVGLDAVKAHEQLVGLAVEAGGVVYPPIYFGSGGGHTEWPHSYMVDADAMKGIMMCLLAGFERDGYQHAILLSGHYPNGRQYLQPAMEAYRQSGGAMRVLAIVETEIPGVSGDHAAKYETSSLLYLDPDIVDMGAMEGMPPGRRGGPEERINWMEDAYQNHPCYGLYGIDPREHASEAIGRENTRRLLDFLKAWLAG